MPIFEQYHFFMIYFMLAKVARYLSLAEHVCNYVLLVRLWKNTIMRL